MKSFEQRVADGLEASIIEINSAPSYDSFFTNAAVVQKSLPVISVLDGKLRSAGNLVDPLDPVIGVDPDKFYDTAFYLGTLVGVRVVAHGFGREEMTALIQRFPDFSQPVEASRRQPIDEEAIRVVNGLARKVHEDGTRGFYDFAAPAEELSGRIAQEMEDICTQPYIRAGLGYLLVHAKTAWDMSERLRMENALKSLESTDKLTIPSAWLQ